MGVNGGREWAVRGEGEVVRESGCERGERKWM